MIIVLKDDLTTFPGGDMIPASSRSSDRATQKLVFIVSHSQQEKICKEVYDYIILKKIQKLKEAILQFNNIIKRILE